jgi:hypothetical protein
MHNEHRTPIELSEPKIDAYTSALSGEGATPGPWRSVCIGHGGIDSDVPVYVVRSESHGVVCEFLYEADARLIAAAPKLLAALRRLFLAADETGAVLAASEDDLCAAANDADADAIVREQAAAVLECRAAIAAATGSEQ